MISTFYRYFPLWLFTMGTSWMLFMTGCYQEKFETGGHVNLAFSTDTVHFDTVFTKIGSATRSFRVYNNEALPVKVSRVSLENGDNRFRLNVDGYQGPEIRDVEIPGHDSIWVFVEVTVDPDQPLSVSPFVIEERIQFETNGNQQSLLLEAWGQNANYFPNRYHQNRISILTCDNGELIWDDPKPYVIYGTLLLDSCTLILPEGAKVYVHGGIANNTLGVYNDGILYTLPDGRLVSRGTKENPVIIQDDRLETDYTGIWGGIRLGPESGPHSLEHTQIFNAVLGIAADSASQLSLNAVEIGGTGDAGLFGRHATINATNVLVYANGSAGMALTYGGNYTLDYCTIANFGNDAAGLIVNNFYCSDPFCQEEIRYNKVTCNIRNTILVGSNSDEILLSDGTPDGTEGMFEYQLEHCIVRVNELTENERFQDFFDHCTGCIEFRFSDTLFVDTDIHDYHLDSLSIAEQRAIPIQGITKDLEGNMRDPIAPDIGCYEYNYE